MGSPATKALRQLFASLTDKADKEMPLPVAALAIVGVGGLGGSGRRLNTIDSMHVTATGGAVGGLLSSTVTGIAPVQTTNNKKNTFCSSKAASQESGYGLGKLMDRRNLPTSFRL